MTLRILYSAMFIKEYFKGSSTFSFRGCLPSGWIIHLLSATLGKNLSSRKLFAFAITLTDEFCKLTVRRIVEDNELLISFLLEDSMFQADNINFGTCTMLLIPYFCQFYLT
ncbi:hypothetical protein TSUD_290250 [Trifolium subterraneum]|uniref:Protein RFT1 homolog n=1 Tax=Trifolium subterraneum TaxID=3900 RepID=A0A2Z6MTG7_TRISU|nr:hypothetical protein TSUD_290250 [Trifolium subterraneum]